MLIPSNFTDAIAEAFYDKTVSVLGVVETTEADGAKHKTHGAPVGTFKGNARLMNFKSVQKEFGIDYQIDITITCDVSTTVVVGDIIEFNGVKYDVTDRLPFDSHSMIVGVKCNPV